MDKLYMEGDCGHVAMEACSGWVKLRTDFLVWIREVGLAMHK
jgi:hypothetical protein